MIIVTLRVAIIPSTKTTLSTILIAVLISTLIACEQESTSISAQNIEATVGARVQAAMIGQSFPTSVPTPNIQVTVEAIVEATVTA